MGTSFLCCGTHMLAGAWYFPIQYNRKATSLSICRQQNKQRQNKPRTKEGFDTAYCLSGTHAFCLQETLPTFANAEVKRGYGST